MKKLHEIVTELEAELAICPAADYPRVCVELCKHLSYVDVVQTSILLNNLLASPIIEKQPSYYAEALILAAGADMNQMKPEDAGKKVTQALTIAQVNKFVAIELTANVQHIPILLYSAKPDEAKTLAIECHQMALSLGSPEDIFHAKTMLYHVLMEHDHNAAGAIIFEAHQIGLMLGKEWLLAYVKFLIGLWNLAIRQLDEAMPFLLDAKNLFEQEGATVYLLSSIDRLATLYNHLGQADKAVPLQFEATRLAELQGDIRNTIGGYYGIANAYRYLKEFELAETYYFKAIELAKLHFNTHEEASAYYLLGNLYKDWNKTDAAIEYLQLGKLKFGDSIRTRLKRDVLSQLQSLYKEKGDFEGAYRHLSEYIDIQLKLQDEQRIKETTRLQQLYEKEKREAELRELHIKKQQAELEQAESELKAIRAQMNPHFIFNALNTIQSYIYLNDKENASNYLGKFSRLTRMVLDMSNNETVSLKDELEALTLYLELERMRFEEVLSFTIDLVGELDTESIKLPAMLVQPYIENAIKHGLLHKKDNRELWCGFQLEGNKLVVTIDDNGIGRQRSAELNVMKGDGHQSFATQANAKRFNLLNKDRDETVGAVYTDKVDEYGQSAGTKVVLTIPVQLDGFYHN